MLIEGSKLQKDLGVKDDTPEKFVEDMLRNGQNLNNKQILSVYAKNVGPTVDWLVGKGIQLRTEGEACRIQDATSVAFERRLPRLCPKPA